MSHFVKERIANVTIKKYFNLEIALANKQISEGKRDLDLKRKMVCINGRFDHFFPGRIYISICMNVCIYICIHMYVYVYIANK
jgi:hypothetical protein